MKWAPSKVIHLAVGVVLLALVVLLSGCGTTPWGAEHERYFDHPAAVENRHLRDY